MSEADLEQLYSRLEKPLCNVVFRWVWSLDDAQDIVQDAFARLWRMRARVDMDTVEPLVYKIALNLAASRRRSNRVWRWISVESLRDATSSARPVDESLMAGEELARLRSAVEGLPEDLRRVIMLCEYSDLSYDEIAGVLSIPTGTVGSRRHRALRQLKHQLSRSL
jgi:RNA polymerase sigma-70 factor (ECF subfamily)